MNILEDLGEDVEGVEVLEVDELAEEGKIFVITVMRRDILL
jgi:hypothetical protein